MTDLLTIHDRGRGPEIRGTRITVYNVMDHHLGGKPAEWIAEFYSIGVEEIHAATQYIDRHIEELMPKYQRDLAWARQGNSAVVEASLSKSHDKLMRLKSEIDSRKSGGSNGQVAG